MKRLIHWVWRLLLLFILLGVTLLWLLQTNSGAKATIRLVNSFASVNIQYSELQGDMSSLLIDDLKITTSALDIETKKTILQWNPFKALLGAQVQIESLTADQLHLTPKQSESADSSTSNNDWRLPVSLDIQSAQINGLKLDGIEQQAIDTLFMVATFEKKQWLLKELNIKHPQLDASLNGTLVPFDEFTHKLSLQFKSPELGEGVLLAEGDTAVSNLIVEVPGHKINTNAKLLNWLNTPALDFVMTVNSENIFGIAANMKVTGKGDLNQGSLALAGELDKQSLSIKALDYQHAKDKYLLQTNGLYQKRPFKLDANFSLFELYQSKLEWKPLLPIEQFRIKSSVTTASGKWTDLNINATVLGNLEAYPVTVKFNAKLQDYRSLTIKPSTLSLLDGSLSLQGTANLSMPYALKVDGKLKNMHLEKLDKRLPKLDAGTLNLDWSHNKKSSLFAQLSDLVASIENKTLNGQAEFRMLDNKIEKATLLITADKDNYVDLNLLDIDKQILALDINLKDLNSIIAEAGGSLEGKLTVAMKNLIIDGMLQAQELNIPDLLSIEKASLEATQNSGQQFLGLSGDNLQVKDLHAQNFNLQLTGSSEQHALAGKLIDKNNRSLELSGEGQLVAKKYRLQLSKLSANSPELGEINNLESIDLQFSESSVSVKPFCLSAELVHLCAELEKSASIVGKFDLNIQANDKASIKQEIGTLSFAPKSDITIKAGFDFDNNNIKKLELDANLEKLSIYNQDDEPLDVENLSFVASGIDNLVDFRFKANSAGGSLESVGKFSGPINAAKIEALIQGNLPKLEDVSPLLISTDIREGELQAEIQISGELKAPRINGYTKIKNTKVNIPELGITQTLNAEITMSDTQNGEISGTIVSGEGKADLKGTIKWMKEPEINLQLTGEKLLIADTKSLSISSSPKLILDYAPGKLDIKGDVDIVRGYSGLSSAGSSTQLSDDVVIIDDEATANKEKIEQLRNIDITTVLSNPVRIDGYGIQGELSGKLRVTQKDSGPVLGNGRLTITGQYKAFGQTLQIESGALNYLNTALDNPSLEFYASRQIADVKVGVRVSGKPDSLVSRLESTPTLRESDILSYLVLGKAPGSASEDESNRLASAAVALALSRSESGIQSVAGKAGLNQLSLSQELGGLALNVGKQFSPRLYVGYTVGFIEPINIAKIRYMLSSKWVLESEMSEETRALLKYRFEKD